MSMTKKERQEMEDLRQELALAKALRWPDYPMPMRMEYPKDAPVMHLEIGWAFTAAGGSWADGDCVQQGCFSSICHSNSDTTKTTTQGRGVFYHTKLAALQALRHKVTNTVAARLARIDRMIAEAEG